MQSAIAVKHPVITGRLPSENLDSACGDAKLMGGTMLTCDDTF
jgi:hypothetical protein